METLQQLLDMHLLATDEYQVTLGQVLVFPMVAIIGLLLIRWLGKIAASEMNKREINPDVAQIVRRAITVLGLIILVITLLDLLQVPLTAFAFVSGAIAIGVGFGAQNIINNFISGWILMWERPIRIHDYIEIGTTTGTVEQINTRSTRIRRIDGVHMLIPNSKLLEETVINWTLVDNLLRCIVRVGVAYGSNVELVANLLGEVASAHPLVKREPGHQVIFEDFGDSALIFDLYFWVDSVGEKSARQIRSDLRFRIDKCFQENDIVIAFPQRDVHINGQIRIESSD
jgi:small-conductance mechanosensitive channel